MAADGSLKFDTKINTDGFEKGVSSIKRAGKACSAAIENTGRSIENAFNKSTSISTLESQISQTKSQIAALTAELNRLGNEKIPTEDFKWYSDAIDKAEKKLESLINRQEKMEAIGTSKQSSSWKSLQYDIEQTSRMLETYKNELEWLSEKEKYTSGKDTTQYQQKAAALGALTSKLNEQQVKLEGLKTKEAEAAREAEKLKLIGENAKVSNPKITELSRELENLNARQNDLKAAGLGFGYTEFERNAQKIAYINNRLNDYKKQILGSAEKTSRFGDIAKGAIGVAKNAVSKLVLSVKSLGSSLAKAAGNGIQNLTSKLKGLHKSAGTAGNGIFKLSNMFKLMLIRMAMRGVIQGVKEGLQNLSQYSSETQASISSLMNSMGYLKNSFAAAFAPILSAVVPALNALINVIATALNYVNQFFSALGGSATFIKAKKTNDNYAKSLGGTGGAAKKAGKEVKKIIAPFDELVQLQKDSAKESGSGGGGGGGGAAPNGLFETAAIDKGIGDFAKKIKELFKAGDWEGLGKFLGEAINKAVQDFTKFISWDNLGAKITEVVTAFTTLFNSLVATIDWYAIGNMFATGINTIAMTLYLLLTQIDWLQLGAAFATGLNGLIQNVQWDLIGKTIGAYFQAQIAMLFGVIEGFDWAGLGIALATALNGIISEINWTMLATAIGDGINGVLKTLTNFIKTFEWSELSQSIAGGLNLVIASIEWAKLGTLLAEGLNTAFNFIKDLALTFDWTGFGESLGESINSFAENFDWASFSAVSTLIIGLLDSLIAFIAEVDWFKLGDSVTTALVSIDWAGMVSKLYEVIGVALGSFAAFIGGLLAQGVRASIDFFKGETEACGGNIVKGIFSGILKIIAGVYKWIWDNMAKPFLNGLGKAFGINNLMQTLGDISKNLWDGFCKGIKELFSNPVSFIKENITDPFINGIKGLLGIHSPSTVMSEMGGYTVDGFNEGVKNKKSNAQTVITDWASGVVSWFSSKLGISGGNSTESEKWANSTMDGFNKSVTAKQKNSQGIMEGWASNIRNWFMGSGESKGINAASWTKFAGDIIKAFGSKISSSYQENKSSIEKWADDTRKWFVGEGNAKGVNEASWTKFAENILNAFKNKINTSNQDVKTSMETWSRGVREWFWGDANTTGETGLYKIFYDMAKRINEGFAKGINTFAHLAKNAIRTWAAELSAEAKSELDIHSPSRVFMKIAGFVVEGFNEGLQDKADTSKTFIEKWLEGIQGLTDKININIPVGFDIPNAKNYFPDVALGKVIPPRAGEVFLRSSYSETDNTENILERLNDVINKLDTERPIQILLNCKGSMSSLVRELKPELDKENTRQGISLVVVGGS